MDASQAVGRAGLLQLLEQIHSQYGLLVLMLVAIIGLGFGLFWKMVWKVWSAALGAKEEEIARLARERDAYQALFLDSLQSTKPSNLAESSSRTNR